jgi:hypothetical protein
MTALPDSSDELLGRLFTIFPRFQANYDGPIFDQPLSYDSVLTAFISDFGLDLPNSNNDQLHLDQLLWPYLSNAVRERIKP